MGKSKKKRFGTAKPQPTGLPSVRECEAELELTGEVDHTPGALQSVVEKLQSASEEGRECGCSTIAAMVSQPTAIRALLDLNVLKILAPLVLDNSLEVRHRALGALRNMSVDGGSEVCEEMVAKDVLTPLVVLIKQFASDGPMPALQKKKELDVAMEICTQAMYLMLNLCENSELAVSVFNKEQLLTVVAPCLTSHSASLRLAVAQCLHTVSEDNQELSALARQTELLATLQTVMAEATTSSEELLVRTLCTGILVNLEVSQLSSARGDLVSSIVSSVSEVLAADTAPLLQKLQQASDDVHVRVKKDVSQKEDETADNHIAPVKNGELEKSMADLLNVLSAQEVALEITANLCCSEDDEWEDMNSSESSSDDQTDCPMEVTTAADNGLVTPLCVPTEIHTAFQKNSIVAKVLQAAQPLDAGQLDWLEGVDSGSKLVKRFASRQTHALLCLNNLVSAVELEVLGGVDKLYSVWQGLIVLSKSPHSLQSHQLLEAVTSATRAVTQKLAEEQAPEKFPEVTPVDLQFLSEMGQKCEWSEVRVNAIRIVSTVGSLLAKQTLPHPLLKSIGMFLLEVVCKDTDLWVVAEGLDAIFDVFGEDHIDPVVKEISLVDRLKALAPMLKSKINSTRKSLGEHYPVIMTARTNLLRFIKYKSSH